MTLFLIVVGIFGVVAMAAIFPSNASAQTSPDSTGDSTSCAPDCSACNPVDPEPFFPAAHNDPIASVAANAGFSGDDLVTAVAIALAESGGNAQAYNPVTKLDSGKPANTPAGQGAIGLWQIYRKAHPEFSTWDLMQPQQNANAAFEIFSARGNFSPWTTYTNGAYLQYMPSARERVNV